MRAFAAALLAVAFAGGTDEEVVQREHVRFTGEVLSGKTCADVVEANEEPGLAAIRFQYELTGARAIPPGRYTGKVTFSITDVLITMPRAFTWPHMNAVDRERAETLRRAVYHHEVGHVRMAEAVRDELNLHDPITAGSPAALGAAADALGRDGFGRFRHEERAYDALTEHGRRQHAAPGELAGPDSTIVCRG